MRLSRPELVLERLPGGETPGARGPAVYPSRGVAGPVAEGASLEPCWAPPGWPAPASVIIREGPDCGASSRWVIINAKTTELSPAGPTHPPPRTLTGRHVQYGLVRPHYNAGPSSPLLSPVFKQRSSTRLRCAGGDTQCR